MLIYKALLYKYAYMLLYIHVPVMYLYVLYKYEIRPGFISLFYSFKSFKIFFNWWDQKESLECDNMPWKKIFKKYFWVVFILKKSVKVLQFKKRVGNSLNVVQRYVRWSSSFMLLSSLKLQPEKRQQTHFHVGGIDLDSKEAVCANWSHVSFLWMWWVASKVFVRLMSTILLWLQVKRRDKCRCSHFPQGEHTLLHGAPLFCVCGIPFSGWMWLEGAN